MSTINNTTTNTLTAFGELITENRPFATSQLTAEDMTGLTWRQYRQLCDDVAVAAYKTLCKADSTSIGLPLAGLFAFFGTDAKATPDQQKRLLLACVTYKAMTTDEYRAAKAAVREAKVALAEAEECEEPDEGVVYAKRHDVEEAEERFAEIAAKPYSHWHEITPMLDSTKTHASAKARKLIEDTIADIITERAMMTVEELQAEAQRLADERKGRKARKEKEAKAAAAQN